VKLAVYLPALNEARTIGALLDAIPTEVHGRSVSIQPGTTINDLILEAISVSER